MGSKFTVTCKHQHSGRRALPRHWCQRGMEGSGNKTRSGGEKVLRSFTLIVTLSLSSISYTQLRLLSAFQQCRLSNHNYVAQITSDLKNARETRCRWLLYRRGFYRPIHSQKKRFLIMAFKQDRLHSYNSGCMTVRQLYVNSYNQLTPTFVDSISTHCAVSKAEAGSRSSRSYSD